jgi:hypothetical protein
MSLNSKCKILVYIIFLNCPFLNFRSLFPRYWLTYSNFANLFFCCTKLLCFAKGTGGEGTMEHLAKDNRNGFSDALCTDNKIISGKGRNFSSRPAGFLIWSDHMYRLSYFHRGASFP